MDTALPASQKAQARNEQWYAVYTNVKQECNVERTLRGKGFDVYLPRVVSHGGKGIGGNGATARRSSRILFPRYVFTRCDVSKPTYTAIKKTIGVKYFVGYDGSPTPIPEEQMDSVRILLQGRDQVALHPALKVGHQVRVIRGPFKGALGQLMEISRNQHRLIVTIDALSSSIAVNIEARDVEPY